jgi:hypothetical protein
MIKQFSAGDITVRPFKTFKHWTAQSIDTGSVDSFGNSTYYNNFVGINEGIKNYSIFYPSGSPEYDSTAEPINPSGLYKRNVFGLIDTMFYKNKEDPFKLFGVEKYGRDPVTGKIEVRNIHNRILAASVNHNSWGEKIRPNTVEITDYSNHCEEYKIYDDGASNLFISGSHFGEYRSIGGINNDQPVPVFNSASVRYYEVSHHTGNHLYITYEQAKDYLNMGVEIGYDEDSVSWSLDLSGLQDRFRSEHEHFGESVGCWNRYVVVGSTMDQYNLSTNRNGYASLYKYDDAASSHRPVKKFYFPLSLVGVEAEFGDSSSLFEVEAGQYLIIERPIVSQSFLSDTFGYAVAVKDDFAVVGSPSGSASSSFDYPGFVGVYHKNKGGVDDWSITNILMGDTRNDLFGNSVSVDGSVLVVGAPGVSGSEGAAFVYRKKVYMSSDPCERMDTGSGTPYFVSGNFTWTREAVISPSGVSSGDKFGWSVAVSSGSIVVGTNKTGAGYVSVFTCSFSSISGSCPTASWVEYKTFYGDDTLGDLDVSSPLYSVDVTDTTIASNGYGKSVAISGKNIIVGCQSDKAFIPYHTYGGSPLILGAAYFYQYYSLCGTASFYQLNKSFGNRQHQTNNNFGKAVTIEGNLAAVTSTPDRLSRSASFNTSSLEFILEEYDYETSGSEDPHGVLGRVTLYQYNETTDLWERDGEIKRNKHAQQPTNIYGYSVSLSSDFLCVGAPIAQTTASGTTSLIFDPAIQSSSLFPTTYSGSAYVYDLNTYETSPLIGNVFYKNGLFVVTNTSSNYVGIMSKTGSAGFELKYQGTHTIYEHEYLVSLRPGEFNYSTNPSSLINNSLLFDVNQDGKFDFHDVDLIMRFLHRKKFFDEYVADDNGFILEQDNPVDFHWWSNDVLQLESDDVLQLEQIDANVAESSSLSAFTSQVYEYIDNRLYKTGLLDADGNGKTTIKDGYIISLYYFDQLTPEKLEDLLDDDSSRRYVKDVKEYLNMYCRQDLFQVNTQFFGYQYSSSYDATGSYLSPFITTIGLYDDHQRLIAVGKLGRPVKNLMDWPVNIIVRFDT